ncbi:MAG TPA: PDZ domain-containing protein [Phycisphaerales bacterium]|nr:PDZ domain-containing protein [Phycisphaerales bacterium]
MPRLTTSILVLALGAGCCAAAAASAPPPDDRRNADALFARLGSESWEARDESHRRLRDGAGLSLADVEAALRTHGADPEARRRITDIGWKHFVNAPHAAMGVQFNAAQESRGVVISDTIAGFDSTRVLRGGDALLSIAGVDVSQQADAAAVIVSHDPGAEIVVVVERDGEVFEAPLRLGAFTALPGMGRGINEATLQRAWEMRVQRIVADAPAPAPVVPGLSPRRWRSEAGKNQPERAQPPRNPRFPAPAPVESADGPGRNPPRAGGSLRRSVRTADGMESFFLTQDRTPVSDSVANLVRQVALNLSRLRQLELVLRDGGADEGRRLNLGPQLAQTRVMLNNTLREVRNLRPRELAMRERAAAAGAPDDE